MTGSVTIKLGSSGGGGSTAWGAITGTLSNQTDLQAALNELIPTGYIMHSMFNVANHGWVLAHGGTIGSASSGASERANADTETLYALLWNGVTDGVCAVSGGRGANAAADFAANKTLTLPDLRGEVMVARLDTSPYFLNPVGTSLGDGVHTLIEAELPIIPDHTHASLGGSVLSTADSGPGAAADGASTTTGGAGGFGSGAAHNNIQPSRIVGAVYLKL